MTWAHMRTVALVSAFASAECLAAPLLTLAVEGPAEVSSPGSVVIAVNATNTDFGLGGLSYALESSVPLTLSGRSYAAFGWVANDGLFDNCSPAEGATLTDATSFKFDTVFAPVASERAAGVSGVIEQLEFAIPAGLADGSVIAFSLSTISASDGLGSDLVVGLRGTSSATGWQIVIPEPGTLVLLGLAWAAVGRRRRGCRRV